MSSDFQLFSSLRYDPTLLQIPDSGLVNNGWNYECRSPLYMLDFHRDRMLRAALHWGWDGAANVLSGEAGLRRLADFILSNIEESQKKNPLRVRVTISRDGELGITSSPTGETPLPNLYPSKLPAPRTTATDATVTSSSPSAAVEFEVLVADIGTTRSEYTHFKTTRREMYDTARQRARIGLPDLKEVLLVNDTDGSIMEGSITTPYFWRDSRWVTPAVSRGYNPESGSGGQDGTSRRWALERGLAVEGSVSKDSLVDGEECWLSNGVRGFVFGRIRL